MCIWVDKEFLFQSRCQKWISNKGIHGWVWFLLWTGALSVFGTEGDREGFLFLHKGGLPLTQQQFWAVTSKALTMLGLVGVRFEIHSFHISSASTAVAMGYPEERVKGLGQWCSRAYQTYVCSRAYQTCVSIAKLGLHVANICFFQLQLCMMTRGEFWSATTYLFGSTSSLQDFMGITAGFEPVGSGFMVGVVGLTMA